MAAGKVSGQSCFYAPEKGFSLHTGRSKLEHTQH